MAFSLSLITAAIETAQKQFKNQTRAEYVVQALYTTQAIIAALFDGNPNNEDQIWDILVNHEAKIKEMSKAKPFDPEAITPKSKKNG